jgi:hypothetical protein
MFPIQFKSHLILLENSKQKLKNDGNKASPVSHHSELDTHQTNVYLQCSPLASFERTWKKAEGMYQMKWGHCTILLS